MKIKSKVDNIMYDKDKKPIKFFIKGNEYEAEKLTDFGLGYMVIDEEGQNNIFTKNRFEKWFEVIA